MRGGFRRKKKIREREVEGQEGRKRKKEKRM